MRPITFTCSALLPGSPESVAANILNVSQWPTFTGCWPVPGIRSAEYELRTPEITRSRIRVVNLDGSTHVEEIIRWQPPGEMTLRMQEFSPPLSKLCTQIVETWRLSPSGPSTHATRSFELYPRSPLTHPALWMISYFLKRAIEAHLRILSQAPPSAAMR